MVNVVITLVGRLWGDRQEEEEEGEGGGGGGRGRYKRGGRRRMQKKAWVFADVTVC